MTVYIVIGRDIDSDIILAVCDTELLALKLQAHFKVSHSDLLIEIEQHSVQFESRD